MWELCSRCCFNCNFVFVLLLWHRDIRAAMECLPGWNAILGLILGFSISVAVVAMIILAEVKRMRLWAKRELRAARNEARWMRPWAQGITRKIDRCTEEEGYLPMWRKSEAQTQTPEWLGAREYAGGIPKGAGRSVPAHVATLSSLGKEGDYVDMSGVHALRDVRCGGVDGEATRSKTEPKKAVRYEAKKERVILPSPGLGQSGEEMVAQGARSKVRPATTSVEHPSATSGVEVDKTEGSDSGKDEVARFFREMEETLKAMNEGEEL